MNFGVVFYIPIESFNDPSKGFFGEALEDKLLRLADEDDSPPRPQSISGWPKVYEAICRDGLFVIQATDLRSALTLRFNPQKQDEGDYEIRPRPHGPIESGRTFNVREVPDDDKDEKVSMLLQFKLRFKIVTCANERPRAKLVWLVGLTGCKNAEDEEITGA